MNKENVLAVADAIERASVKGLGFNMTSYVDKSKFRRDHTGKHCGTVACIAGWAAAVQDGDARRLKTLIGGADYWSVPEAASVFLGLDDDRADALFQPNVTGIVDAESWNDITPSQAVSCLRHLAKTGKVNWKRALATPERTK